MTDNRNNRYSGFSRYISDDRAQLYTLEGAVAAAILLMVIVYVVNVTSVGPMATSASNLRIEAELKTLGEDVLNVLDNTDSGSKLKKDVANWSGDEYVWNGTAYVEYGTQNYTNNFTNNITDVLRATLVAQGIAHEVDIVYLGFDTNNVTVPKTVQMIYGGIPSNDAVIVSRKIVLHDADNVSVTSPIKDIDRSKLYNIADVKIIMWKR